MTRTRFRCLTLLVAMGIGLVTAGWLPGVLNASTRLEMSPASGTNDGPDPDGGGNSLQGLEGTWRVTVVPDPGGPPPSQSYHTYSRGGGLVQSNLTEGNLPGQGAWVRVGPNRFVLTLEKFVSFNPLTGEQGTFVFKVKETIWLQGDKYIGRGEGAFCNAAGGACVSVGCATTRGRRMRIEAPSCPL